MISNAETLRLIAEAIHEEQDRAKAQIAAARLDAGRKVRDWCAAERPHSSDAEVYRRWLREYLDDAALAAIVAPKEGE